MNLANVAAMPGGGEIDHSDLLGVLVMYAIPDRPLPYTTVARAWLGASLPEERIPNIPSKVNIFQRACRSVETKRGPSKSESDKDEEINVDRIILNAGYCVYQVTRVVRLRSAERLVHKRAMVARFWPGQERLDFEFETPDDPDMTELATAIRRYYEDRAGMIMSTDIRSMVRETLIGANGTSMRGRGGGVYFIPIDQYDTVSGIDQALREMYDENVTFSIVPMIDNKNARDIVREQHDAGVQSELMDLINEVRTRIQDPRAVREEFFSRIVMEKKKLEARRRRYSDILDRETDLLEEKDELINDLIMKLEKKLARNGNGKAT